MTKRINNPVRKARRALARIHRAIVPVRQSGGSAIVAIPKSVRQAIELQIGDYLLIEFNPETHKIEMSKDSEGNRKRALYQAKNLEIIGDRIRDAHEAKDSKRWEQMIENVCWGLLNHLKGKKLGDSDDNNDDNNDDNIDDDYDAED